MSHLKTLMSHVGIVFCQVTANKVAGGNSNYPRHGYRLHSKTANAEDTTIIPMARLTVAQLVKSFPAALGILRLTSVFTRARHCFRS